MELHIHLPADMTEGQVIEILRAVMREQARIHGPRDRELDPSGKRSVSELVDELAGLTAAIDGAAR